MSDRQIELLLSNLDTHSFTTRDEQEVAGYAEASRSTIKARLNELVKEEKIYRYGKGRSTCYSL